jgi:hypothetical protein
MRAFKEQKACFSDVFQAENLKSYVLVFESIK